MVAQRAEERNVIPQDPEYPYDPRRLRCGKVAPHGPHGELYGELYGDTMRHCRGLEPEVAEAMAAGREAVRRGLDAAIAARQPAVVDAAGPPWPGEDAGTPEGAESGSGGPIAVQILAAAERMKTALTAYETAAELAEKALDKQAAELGELQRKVQAVRELCDQAEQNEPDAIFSQGGPVWGVWTSDVRKALGGDA